MILHCSEVFCFQMTNINYYGDKLPCDIHMLSFVRGSIIAYMSILPKLLSSPLT